MQNAPRERKEMFAAGAVRPAPHRIEIHAHRPYPESYHIVYSARCACGWRSAWGLYDDAEAQGGRHVLATEDAGRAEGGAS